MDEKIDEVLVARGIRSYAGREVVAGLDLELKRGECYGLLGSNGARSRWCFSAGDCCAR